MRAWARRLNAMQSKPRFVGRDLRSCFGVRVIVNGAWGFASSPLVTPEEIARITGEAVIIARANATIQPKPVMLAPVKAYRDRWETPHDRPWARRRSARSRTSGSVATPFRGR
jgi:predicted Zn-dependent protease